MPTWQDVIDIGLRYPTVEVTTAFGKPSLKAGKMMCVLRDTEPEEILYLRVTDEGEKEALLQGNPDVFFTTPHYDGHPGLLVRLAKVDPVELGELIEDAWRLRAPKRVVSAHFEVDA